jgi:hypothetical protein
MVFMYRIISALSHGAQGCCSLPSPKVSRVTT